MWSKLGLDVSIVDILPQRFSLALKHTSSNMINDRALSPKMPHSATDVTPPPRICVIAVHSIDIEVALSAVPSLEQMQASSYSHAHPTVHYLQQQPSGVGHSGHSRSATSPMVASLSNNISLNKRDTTPNPDAKHHDDFQELESTGSTEYLHHEGSLARMASRAMSRSLTSPYLGSTSASEVSGYERLIDSALISSISGTSWPDSNGITTERTPGGLSLSELFPSLFNPGYFEVVVFS